MNHSVAILKLVTRVPRWLRALRARMLLDECAERLGVREVECPACGGGGWLNEKRLERCPICCGFRQVPRSLAEWVERELLKLEMARLMQSLPRCAREPEPEGMRYGRCGEVLHRVSVPGLCELARPGLSDGAGL